MMSLHIYYHYVWMSILQKNIVKSIKNYRETGEKDFDDIILSVLMEKDNYKQALNLLKTEPISEELICNVGINRKSAKYDKPYYTLYSLLKRLYFQKIILH